MRSTPAYRPAPKRPPATRYGAAIAILASLAALNLPAHAEWPADAYTYRGLKNDLYWGRYHCGGRYREEGCDAWRRRQRYARYRHRRHRAVAPRDPGAVCHPLTAATGEQAQSEDSAQTLALRSWQGRVRFHYGERFIALETARDVRIACSPSSVADTVGGKLQDKLLGISHFRCEISGRPCRAEAKPLQRDDD